MKTYNCQKTADDRAIATFVVAVLILVIGSYAREYGNEASAWAIALGSTTMVVLHICLLYLEYKKTVFSSPSDILRIQNIIAKKQQWLTCYQESQMPPVVEEQMRQLDLELLKIVPTSRAWIDPFSKIRSLLLIIFRLLEFVLNLCALFLLISLYKGLGPIKTMSQRIDGILFACACACFMRWSISLLLLYIDVKQIEELNKIKTLPDSWTHPNLHKNSDEES